MKNVNILLLLLVSVIGMALLFTGCKKKEADNEETKEDDYDKYLIGSDGGKTEYEDADTVVTMLSFGYYSDMAPEEYTLRRTSDGATFDIEDMNLEAQPVAIDVSYMEKIDKWVDKYDIRKWDGFSMTRSDVMDGSGFNIAIELDTGESIYASGSNAWPDNFSDAYGELYDILENARDDAMTEYYSHEAIADMYSTELSLTVDMFENIATEDWQKAYRGLLEDKSREYELKGSDYLKEYFIYDIDKDGSPELFIKSGTCEADYIMQVYYFDGTEAKSAGELGAGHTTYYTYPDGNGFIEHYGHMATATITRIGFDGSSLVLPGKLVYEDRLYEKVPTDPDADYIPVRDVVEGAEVLGVSPLDFTYRLLEYSSPLVASYDSEMNDDAFESKVRSILGTEELFYGVTANKFGGRNIDYGAREMGMLELYERDGLFEDSDETVTLRNLYFEDFNDDGKNEAFAVFSNGDTDQLAPILFAYQNGRVYGYIAAPFYASKMEVEAGHIYLHEDYMDSLEVKYDYYLDQCNIFYQYTDRMVIGEEARDSLRLFKQDVRGDKGELAVAYLGNAGLYSEKYLNEVMKENAEKYSDEEFMGQLNRIHCVKQPGEEVYLLVPAEDDYVISVYEQIWGEDTPDGMPKRGELLFKAEPGDAVIVRGNQSDIVPNLEIVMDMNGKELVYQPSLSLDDGRLTAGDGILDFTRYNN